jgi:hypothetical protein
MVATYMIADGGHGNQKLRSGGGNLHSFVRLRIERKALQRDRAC